MILMGFYFDSTKSVPLIMRNPSIAFRPLPCARGEIGACGAASPVAWDTYIHPDFSIMPGLIDIKAISNKYEYMNAEY